MQACLSIAAVAAGAALGALLRYALNILVNQYATWITLGTLTANYLGCLLMGCWLAFSLRLPLPSWLNLALSTGFLGGLTTFSSLIGEAAVLLQHHQRLHAALIVLLHLGGGLCLTLGALLLCECILRHG